MLLLHLVETLTVSPSGRPVFEPRETLPKFSKDKRPIRALYAVPEWNILISLIGKSEQHRLCCSEVALQSPAPCACSITHPYTTDGNVASHFLSALSKPPFPMTPTGKGGVQLIAPSNELGILCVTTRTGLRLLQWQGVSTIKGVTSPLFTAFAEHEVQAILPASAAFASSDRRRRGSFIGIPVGIPPAKTASPHICITTVSWVGVLLVVGIIRRADVSLHEEVDDVPIVNLVGGASGGETPDDEDARISPYTCTGYALSYLFMHPWTGRVLREVRCGAAPPLDATGYPVPARRGDGSDASSSGPGSSGLASADGYFSSPGAVAAAEEAASNMVELLGPGWSSSPLCQAVVSGGKGSAPLNSATAGANGRVIPGWGPAAILKEPSAGLFVDPALEGGGVRGAAMGRSGRRGSVGSTGSRDSTSSRGGAGGGGGEDDAAAGAVVLVGIAREPPASAVDSDGAPINSPVGGLYLVGPTLCADGSLGRAHTAGSGGHSAALHAGHATPIAFTSYPVSLYASPNFPYLLAAQADGLVVYNARTGGVVQRVKRLPNVLGFAACPEEARARLNFASGRVAVGNAAGGPGGSGSGGELSLSGGGGGGGIGGMMLGNSSSLMTPEYVIRAVSQPEYLYAFVSNGVVMLGMVPVVMQVAALISQRPPEFEAALALCEHFRAIRTRVRALEAAQRAAQAATAAAALHARGPTSDDAEGDAVEAAASAAAAAVSAAASGGAAPAAASKQLNSTLDSVDDDGEVEGQDGKTAASAAGAAAVAAAGAGGSGSRHDEDAGEEDDRAFKALGGVPGSKIRLIRAQFGYQLFARGDFGQALFHLANAREPPARVLSLFHQLLPAGVRLRPSLPVAMPVMIDATLPAAIKPLIPYLLQQRRRLRCHTGRVVLDDDPGAPEDGSADAAAGDGGAASSSVPASALGNGGSSGGGGSAHIGDLLRSFGISGSSGGGGDGTVSLRITNNGGIEAAGATASAAASARGALPGSAAAAARRRLPTAVLVDTVLLTAFLWNEAHLAAEARMDASAAASAAAAKQRPQQGGLYNVSPPSSSRGTVDASSSSTHLAYLRTEQNKMRRGTDRLLSSPNCVDLEEAELQLRAFRGSGAGGGGSELVTLFRGKGAHASAVRILARSAEDALAAAAILAAEVREQRATRRARLLSGGGDLDDEEREGNREDSDEEEEDLDLGSSALVARDTVLRRVHALTAYLRSVGSPHETLVLPHLRELLTGRTMAGVEGLLLALAALLPPVALLRRGLTETAAAAQKTKQAAATAAAAAAASAAASAVAAAVPGSPSGESSSSSSSGVVAAPPPSAPSSYTAARRKPFVPLSPETVVAFLSRLQCAFSYTTPASASGRGGGGGGGGEATPAKERGLLRSLWRLRGSAPLPSDADPERLAGLLFAPSEADASGAMQVEVDEEEEADADASRAPPGVAEVHSSSSSSAADDGGGSDDGLRTRTVSPAGPSWSAHLSIAYLEHLVYAAGDAEVVSGSVVDWAAHRLACLYVAVCASLLHRRGKALSGGAAATAVRYIYGPLSAGGIPVTQNAADQQGRLGVYRRRLLTLLQRPQLRIDDGAVIALFPEAIPQALPSSSHTAAAAAAAAPTIAPPSTLTRGAMAVTPSSAPPSASPRRGAPHVPVVLAEERVLLFRRLGAHEAALRILVRSLNDYAAAEEYCSVVRKDAEDKTAAWLASVPVASTSAALSGSGGGATGSSPSRDGAPAPSSSLAGSGTSSSAAAGGPSFASPRCYDTPERLTADMDVYNALLRAYLRDGGDAASATAAPSTSVSAHAAASTSASSGSVRRGQGQAAPSTSRSALPPSHVVDIADGESAPLVVGASAMDSTTAVVSSASRIGAPNALSAALLGYSSSSSAAAASTPPSSMNEPSYGLQSSDDLSKLSPPLNLENGHREGTSPLKPQTVVLQQSTPASTNTAAAAAGGGGGVVAQVMDIMSRNFNRVDASAALAALPPSISLAAVAPFLVSAIRHSQDSVRAFAVSVQLNGLSHLKMQSDLLEKQTRCTVIERNTTCSVCKRRLAAGGNLSVFTTSPDGKISHLGCGPVPGSG